ncbi:MAG: membrane protein insertase YidC [Methylophilaceae bacterium]|nr:MAG: membrane protein insertase YidC [Methylophilaceae bacterium]
MDTKRLVLFVVFSFSIMMLWDAWQVKDRPINADNTASETSTAAETSADVIPAASSQAVVTADSNQTQVSGERIKVSTDLYQAEISTLGGDIRHLTLNKHRADGKEQGRFVLMDDAAKPMFYVAQSGLIGKDLPNHKTLFTAEKSRYVMASGSNTLQVVLSWLGNDGTKVEKIYTFHRDRYEIDLTHRINNAIGGEVAPSVYYQITHDSESNQGSTFMPTFTGGAYYTDADKFKKIKFSEMADRNLSLKTKDGWIGVIQHYFASAWIPKAGTSQEFYTKQLTDNLYAVGVVNPIGKIAPAATNEISATLFSGPQTEADLEAAAPGLEYAVDYGWLTIIAKPLFWLLSNIHGFIGNWGVAIIVLTILLKAAFFKLSATSYRSMAHMREMAPRMQSLKEKFGDDKQKLQQAMMEMYRKEKINPLSGCLPILVQIPVFIALYWVLLGSVELRHAPFFGWITDLSAKDPYYILPILMGASMIVQTYLNPAPADPLQAKIMKIMPVVFSIFFFFFPAGLVLYWLVNNILSIAQQWYINKTIHAETLAKKGSGKR